MLARCAQDPPRCTASYHGQDDGTQTDPANQSRRRHRLEVTLSHQEYRSPGQSGEGPPATRDETGSRSHRGRRYRMPVGWYDRPESQEEVEQTSQMHGGRPRAAVVA
eukprot:scaffold109923_cov30-Tisochrysis_lutea.AAC.3